MYMNTKALVPSQAPVLYVAILPSSHIPKMCEEIFSLNEKKTYRLFDAINYREEKRAIMTKIKCPRESFFCNPHGGADAMQDPEMQCPQDGHQKPKVNTGDMNIKIMSRRGTSGVDGSWTA